MRHPLREQLRRQLMLALCRSGRQAEALATYGDARAVLDELGLLPSRRLRELELAILRHDESLDGPALSGGTAATEVSTTRPPLALSEPPLVRPTG